VKIIDILKLKNMKKFIFLVFITVMTFACTSNASKKEKQSYQDSMANVVDTLSNINNPYQNADFEIITFKSGPCSQMESLNDSCWGYDIYVFGELIIHQPHKPAVSGNEGFKTEDAARKTAELVVKKLKNNIMPPSITARELDSIGVLN